MPSSEILSLRLIAPVFLPGHSQKLENADIGEICITNSEFVTDLRATFFA
jgi:hypothetical protein